MNFVTSISLVVLGAMFLALLGWGSIRAAWRNCEGRRGVFAALAILAAICSIVAQKPSPDTPTITVDALLRDVGCYATNNVFHAAVTNAPSYAGVDFSDCDLMVYARERGSTDAASWFELTPRKKFSQQPADYAIENATNFNYMVYLNYVPPSPVHTNGVFELYGFVIGNEAQGEPDQLAAGFINSRRLLPPPTARDYVQDGLIAMWDGIDHGDNPLIWRDLSGNGFDATQRVATGWSWTDKSYVGVESSNGFRVPQTFSSALREAVEHHTVELVFKPNSWRRQTIFGQYNGNVGAGLNYEFYSRPQSFRAYYYALPDYSVGAWSSTEMQRRTVAVVCDGSQLSIYVDGVKTGQSNQPTAKTIHGGLSMIIGGENSRANMSIEGALFCVRAYSRALTEEELKRHTKIDNERFNQ